MVEDHQSWTARWSDVMPTILVSAFIGFVRLLYLIRQGRRRWRLVDIVVEPSIAVIAGVSAWYLSMYQGAPPLLQPVIVSVAAWAGPRFLATLEAKYLNRLGVEPTPLDKEQAPPTAPGRFDA